MSEYLFYFLAFVSIFAALLVVTAKNPIHSVLFLIVTFFAIAGQYIILNAQFLAIVHIIVYAGAIMVLFLFVLMLLNLNKETEPVKSYLMKGIGVLAGCLLALVMLAALHKSTMSPALGLPNEDIGLVGNLGKVLFKEYVVPFEVSSLLFLSAMIGAVMLGKRDPKIEPVNETNN